MKNRTSDLRIPRSDSQPWSCMTRIPRPEWKVGKLVNFEKPTKAQRPFVHTKRSKRQKI